MKYTIEIMSRALKDIKALPRKESEKIIVAINRLGSDLMGAVRTNYTPEYSLRWEDYEKMRETLEDYNDLRELRKTKADSKGEKPIPFAKAIKQLKK